MPVKPFDTLLALDNQGVPPAGTSTGGTPLRVRAFAQVGEAFQHLLMGETPKTAMLHQRNCLTATVLSPNGSQTRRVLRDSPLAGFPRLKELSRLGQSILSQQASGTSPLNGGVSSPQKLPSATQVSHHRNCLTASAVRGQTPRRRQSGWKRLRPGAMFHTR